MTQKNAQRSVRQHLVLKCAGGSYAAVGARSYQILGKLWKENKRLKILKNGSGTQIW